MRAGIKADSKDKYMRETCTHRRVQTLRNTRIVLFVYFEPRFMVRKRERGDVCTLIFDVYKSVLPENIVHSLSIYIDPSLFFLEIYVSGDFVLECCKIIIIKITRLLYCIRNFNEEIKNNNIFKLIFIMLLLDGK